MISTKEQVLTNLAELDEAQLQTVAEFLQFIKFRQRYKAKHTNPTEVASLYAEFADEDRELAELGFADYEQNLTKEDSAK